MCIAHRLKGGSAMQSKANESDRLHAKTYTFMIMNAQLRKERNPARDARIHVRVNATN